MLLHMEELYESIKVLRDKDGIFIAVQHMLHGARLIPTQPEQQATPRADFRVLASGIREQFRSSL